MILDHVEYYGNGWLDQTYQFIQEDKKEMYVILSALFPLGRTPMDESGGRWMTSYGKSIEKMLDSLTPWESTSRMSDIRRKVKSGEIVVISDGTESPTDPLLKDARVMKSRTR